MGLYCVAQLDDSEVDNSRGISEPRRLLLRVEEPPRPGSHARLPLAEAA